MTRAALASALSLVLMMCGGRNPDPDAGPAQTDAGASGMDAGGAALDAGDPEIDPADAEALADAVRAFGIASSLAGPLVEQTEMLRDETGAMDDTGRRGSARARVEAGVSGNSVVEPAGCAAFDWMGLGVTVTLTGCTLEATGEPISGAIGLRVSFFPTRIALTFTSLTIGATGLDGALTLNVGGECMPGHMGCTECPDTDPMCATMRATQVTVSGDLTLNQGGVTAVAVNDLSLTVDSTGITVGGALDVGGTEVSGSDLFFATGDCLPSSGTASIAATSTTLTFLPATPTTGNVAVMIGAIPLGEQMLFTPCS